MKKRNTRRLTAFGVLSLALKIKETADFEERISRLEEILEARPN